MVDRQLLPLPLGSLTCLRLLPHSAKIAAGAVVCVESEVRGDVTIGEGGAGKGQTVCAVTQLLLEHLCSSTGARTVVHPKARIIAEAGPIVIGEGNLIEEQALIINRCVGVCLRHISTGPCAITWGCLPAIQRTSCPTQMGWSRRR